MAAPNPVAETPDRPLTSWKEIAAYLGVSVRTAQRWEAEGLPVRRHQHAKLSSIYAYVNEVAAWWDARPDPARQTDRRLPVPLSPTRSHHKSSIAVLPFLNLDREQRTEILSDGLTEDLITALSQSRNLKVVARTSTLHFRGKPMDIRDVGAQLGVETVLEGSMRAEGKRMRVTAQLINAADGCHLWAQRFDREVDDPFDLQDELSRAIVQSLRIQLGAGERLAHRRTRDAETYNLFLEGRYSWNQRTQDRVEKAIACYEQVIDREPGFAPAYAGIADCYVFLWVYGEHDWGKTVKKAEAMALEALKIDPGSGDAHSSLGLTRVCQYDMRGADRAFRNALDLNPGDARARHWWAMALANLGRLDEAISEAYHALELDRFGVKINQDTGRILYLARRYDEAILQLRHTLEIDTQAYWARVYLGFAYVQVKRFQEALSGLRSGSDSPGFRTRPDRGTR